MKKTWKDFWKEEEGMGRCKCGEMLIIVEPGGWEFTVQLKTFSIYIKSKPEKLWEMRVFWCQNDM